MTSAPGRHGRFIVIEGLDGSGTTTQAQLLGSWLSDMGISPELTREPTTGPFGLLTRMVVEQRVSVDSRALALAFAADRIDHVECPDRGIRGWLRRGRWVVSDRYVLSSFAYQSGDVAEYEWLTQINRFALTPDLTIFVDVPVSECRRRIRGRSASSDLFDVDGRLERVGSRYREVLASLAGEDRFTGELAVVDGEHPPEVVATSIRGAVLAWAGRHGLATEDGLRIAGGLFPELLRDHGMQ